MLWRSELLAGESETACGMEAGIGWKETNSGKKVQFGERQGERLLNEIGARGGTV